MTIQAQIIELLLELQQQENMALVLITHDLALVAEAAMRKLDIEVLHMCPWALREGVIFRQLDHNPDLT